MYVSQRNDYREIAEAPLRAPLLAAVQFDYLVELDAMRTQLTPADFGRLHYNPSQECKERELLRSLSAFYFAPELRTRCVHACPS